MLPVEFAQYAVIAVGAISALSVVSAIARRIAGPSQGRARLGALAMMGREPESGQELEALRDEVDKLRAELASRGGEIDEIQNRLDFAERMLAQVREKPALPGA